MLFKRFFNQSHSLNSEQFINLFAGGGITKSGEVITAESSLEIGAIYACVNIKANAIAKLPLQLFIKSKNGRERNRSHAVSHLLEKRPNKYMTPFVFKHTITVHRNLWGNAYIKINFNGPTPSSLDILNPERVQVYKDTEGQLWYVYTSKKKQEVYHSDEIIHLPYLSTDGINGKSPISIARETAGTMKAAQKFVGGLYKNGVTNKGILKTDTPLDKTAKEKVREEWQLVNAGVDNAGKVAILSAGFDYQSITMPLADAEFIATQKFNLAEIARIFNVPLHMLNELDRSTFSNIEHQKMEFVMDTIQPELVSWEEECNYKLFTEREQMRYYVKFNLTSALRGDNESRAKYYKEMIQMGVLSINEVRALEEADAVELGDKHLVSLNYTFLDNLEEYQRAKVNSKNSKGGENDEGKVSDD